MHRSKLLTLLGSLVLLALVAVACGDDDGGGATSQTGGGTSATTAAAEDDAAVDPDGVLRIVQNVTAANLTFDPTTAGAGVHQVLVAVYGSLLTKTGLGQYEPNLATRVEIIDPQTIEVELREGMTFSDDTPVDAEALKVNLERFATTGNIKGLRSEIMKDLREVEVKGPLSATVHLSTPTSGIVYDLFAGPETVLISPAALASGVDLSKQAVGAGPFLVESWQPDVKLTLVRNPDYWNADEVKLAGVEFIQLQAGPPVVNALRTNAVDVAAVDHSVAQSLVDPIATDTFRHPGTFILNVCKKDEPLSDVRVRQAMAHAMDRELLAQRLYGGATEPVWSLQREGDPYYDPELEGIYEYDPDRARQLLAEAGYPDGFSTSLIGTPGNSTTAGEVLQGLFAEVGIDLELRQTQNIINDFYIEGRAQLFPINQTRSGLDAYTVLLLPGAFANVCQYSNPEIEQVMAKAMAAPPDSDEAVDAWHELAALVQQELPFIPIVFHSQVVASNSDRVGGLSWYLDEFGNAVAQLDGTYIKA